jgi:hypothetical protein
MHLKQVKMAKINNEVGIMLSKAKSIIDVIESKSLMSRIGGADSKDMTMSHEKILFATIHDSNQPNPEMKLLSALGRFEEDEISGIKIKERTQSDGQ